MRRYLWLGALLVALATVTAARAVAQHHHHLQASSGAWSHHHHHAGANSLFYWNLGYPLGWGLPYTPVFGTYTYMPMYSYTTIVQPPPAPAAVPFPARVEPPAQEAEAARNELRASTAEQKAKSERYVALGDANFAKQKYFLASERYKSATNMAPDTGEPYVRQAFSLVALGQYASAAKMFRRGLKVRSDWSDSALRLDEVYGGGNVAKTEHFEKLAKAVEANPLDASLLTVLGLQLYFDGQVDRSMVFLTRAAQLGGNSDHLLDDLLPKPGPAGARPAAPPKIVF